MGIYTDKNQLEVMSFLYLWGFKETACYPNDACTCCHCTSL